MYQEGHTYIHNYLHYFYNVRALITAITKIDVFTRFEILNNIDQSSFDHLEIIIL